MTYTGPPAPREGHEVHRQASGAAGRAYSRGMHDDAQAPILLIGVLLRLLWWFPKTMFRLARRR